MAIKIPKDREVPFGAITPAPVRQQELFITSNWRIVRPHHRSREMHAVLHLLRRVPRFLLVL